MSFDHFYNTEAEWDGGRVEISIDNGSSWIDLGDYFITNGYNSFIEGNTSRRAFAGNSGAYINSVIDLEAFCGYTALIRFNFYYDEAVDAEGWYVDNIIINKEEATINTATATHGSLTSTDIACVRVGVLTPVELLEFEAIAQEESSSILLEWTTLSEINNEGFEIQRKAENEREFKTISWLDGQGESNEEHEYSYIDNDVERGITYYYRLKQIDFDKSFEYSNIRTAILLGNDLFVKFYPNPINNNELLNMDVLNINDNETLEIQIFNQAGMLMSNQRINANDGSTYNISIKGLASGVYFIRVQGQSSTFVEKLRVY